MGISHNIAERQAANTQPFTPGPWGAPTLRYLDSGKSAYTISQHDSPIVLIVSPDTDGSGEGKANALLIAAAPDMYEALKRIAESNPSMELFDIASAALFKARGGL